MKICCPFVICNNIQSLKGPFPASEVSLTIRACLSFSGSLLSVPAPLTFVGQERVTKPQQRLRWEAVVRLVLQCFCFSLKGSHEAHENANGKEINVTFSL